MSRAVCDRILKDVDGNISDHLRNHIHLTNCIHLKNHIHKNSPILSDRALVRDLIVLQRSKSLRDPSASPSSWHASSGIDVLYKRGERGALENARKSAYIDRPTESGRMSGSYPPVDSHRKSKATAGHISGDGILERRRMRREELSGKSLDIDVMRWHVDHSQRGNCLISDSVPGNFELRDKSAKRTAGNGQDRHRETLCKQLENARNESDDADLSQKNNNTRQAQVDKIAEEAGTNFRSHCNNLTRAKKRRFRSSRRTRPSIAPREFESQNEMSVTSNSFFHGRVSQKYVEEGVEENDDQNVTGVPKNGCGIPWNWSSIHNRGKSFLDMAGRSLSCGLSDTRLKKDGSFAKGRRDMPDTPVMSEHGSSFIKSVGEVFPLLLDAQGSIDHGAWSHDYSGELGIFADDLLKQEIDSNLEAEGRFHEQHKFRRKRNDMHQNITEKYMPRTFRDLVGQNLVVQALSNAIAKRKIGLLYVFYGPQGTGKTSCARTFARALNCQSLEQSKPCGVCNSCVAHDMGKNQNIREVSPVCNTDFDGIIEVLNKMIASKLQSHYKVFIFDECDSLSSDCWSAMLKVIDRSPRRVVFILVCSSLDVLPHIIISRCQKFFFPKLKDADIIYTLEWIATKEELEIDKDALKLIASRSDGSLRDAEMTLEQLSLLGQRISLCLVQELVGLISDEKLIDLLDLALSEDTVNTVKNLRDIMESGVEPVALISQLATVITDILAGNFDFLNGRPKRKFFQRQTLTKEDMEKLRQALKTLSEAEKQLRVSNDRMTWLTAALLQLAPDQQYVLPSSLADNSIDQSPLPSNNDALNERPRKSNAELLTSYAGSSRDVNYNAKLKGSSTHGKGHIVGDGVFSQQLCTISNDKSKTNKIQLRGKYNQKLEEIWLEVLEKIPINGVKEFMYKNGKLMSLSYGAAPIVQLLFNSQLVKPKAENFRLHILQAFESVLRSPVAIEIRYDSRKDIGAVPILLPASQAQPRSDVNPILTSDGIALINQNEFRSLQDRAASAIELGRSEIVEVETSAGEHARIKCNDDKVDFDKKKDESVLTAQRMSPITSFPDQRKFGERNNQSLSLVRGRLSLAHVIQQTDTCGHQSGWSKRKAVSIAEKLEQENLRLEPKSRRILCWNPPRVSRRKLSRLRTRTRTPPTLLKYFSCGRCLYSRFSRQC